MYKAKLAGVYILFFTSVCVRCRSRIKAFPRDVLDLYSPDVPAWNSRDVPARNCDTENKNTLAEIKSEIQNLKHLVVGLRQKVDPGFRLPPPRKFKKSYSFHIFIDSSTKSCRQFEVG